MPRRIINIYHFFDFQSKLFGFFYIYGKMLYYNKIYIMRPENNEINYNNCICKACPSYNECTQRTDEKGFCMDKRSSCKIDKNSCICGSCPVYNENNLSGGYFCIDEKGY